MIKHEIVTHPFWPIYKAMRDSIYISPEALSKEAPHVKKYVESLKDAVETYDIADPSFKEQWEHLNERPK